MDDGGFDFEQYNLPGPYSAAATGAGAASGFDPLGPAPPVDAAMPIPREARAAVGEDEDEYRFRFEGFLDLLFTSGDYTIRRIGGGLYGELYKVCDKRNKTKCMAIKPSCAYKEGNARSCERFRHRAPRSLSDGEEMLVRRLLTPAARPRGALRNVGSFLVTAKEGEHGVLLAKVSPNFVNTYGYMEKQDGLANIFMEMVEKWTPNETAMDYIRGGTDPKAIPDGSRFSTVFDFFSKVAPDDGNTFAYMEDILVQVVDAVVKARKALPAFKHQDFHANNILLTNWHVPAPMYGNKYVLRPGAPRVVIVDYGLSTSGKAGGELYNENMVRRAGITPVDCDMYDLFRLAGNLEIVDLIRRDLTVARQDDVTTNRFSRLSAAAASGLSAQAEYLPEIPARAARQTYRPEYKDVVLHYYWAESHHEEAHASATPHMLGQREVPYLLEAEQKSIVSAQRDRHVHSLEGWYSTTNLFRCLRFLPRGNPAYWGSSVPPLERLKAPHQDFFRSPDNRAFEIVNGKMTERGVVVNGEPVEAEKDPSAYMWWPRAQADQAFWAQTTSYFFTDLVADSQIDVE